MSSKTASLDNAHPSSAAGNRTFKVSIIMPVYNQRASIGEIIYGALAAPVNKELIVIDDGSDDGTELILRDLHAHIEMKVPSFTFPNQGRTISCANLHVLLQPRNRGKGAAIRRALKEATGDVVMVQDADLGLDPQDYPKLLAPIERGTADVIYGSRFLGESRGPKPVSSFLANKVLTATSNLLTGLKLSDAWTGCKMFRREIIQSMPLREERFGFEPEITARVAKSQQRVTEVPISYGIGGKGGINKLRWRNVLLGICYTFRVKIFS